MAKRLGVTVKFIESMLASGMKWCTPCKKWHKREAFGRDASTYDGLSSKCLNSRIVRVDAPGSRERRIALAKGLRWCSPCDGWLPADEVTQGKCRHHANEAYRRWYANHSAEVSARNYARIRGLAPIPAWWRAAAFDDFGGLCGYGCGRPCTALDHITPVALGGISEPGNLVPSCTSCNSRKRHGDPAPWVSRGIKAFPDQWLDICALAHQVGRSTDWADWEVA